MGLVDLFPVVVAGLAMASSVCLWALQRRRERPGLRAYANRLAVQGLGPTEVEQPLTVANLSALPDVLLAVRVWGKLPNGDWQPARAMQVREPSYLRPKARLHTKLPINLAPHQTATFYVHLEFGPPMTECAEPFHYKVELTGLGGRTHVCEVVKRPAPG